MQLQPVWSHGCTLTSLRASLASKAEILTPLRVARATSTERCSASSASGGAPSCCWSTSSVSPVHGEHGPLRKIWLHASEQGLALCGNAQGKHANLQCDDTLRPAAVTAHGRVGGPPAAVSGTGSTASICDTSCRYGFRQGTTDGASLARSSVCPASHRSKAATATVASAGNWSPSFRAVCRGCAKSCNASCHQVTTQPNTCAGYCCIALHTSENVENRMRGVMKCSPQGAVVRVEQTAEAPAWRSTIRLCGADWPPPDPAGSPRIYPGTACPE